RDQMANEGIITVVVPVDLAGERIAGEPVITVAGLLMRLEDALRDEMMVALRESIESMLERGTSDPARLEKRVASIAASYIYRGHRRRPKIQPIILDVS
ncbi:MAG: hypothetical protein M3173_01780, partial [Chloroflexota bacterium]|nr:hypothetical protein [Chloroflexota bacterium]